MPDAQPAALPGSDRVIADTRAWVDEVVIGLNLCPFARAVQVKRQVRYVVTDADDAESLLGALIDELNLLAEADPAETDTTLLIHPRVLGDFDDYNQFLDIADGAVEALGLEGVIQVASFHPDYCFDGIEPDDIGNETNRSPWPMLHLLREASVERAVDAFPDADAIVERNQRTLRELGAAGVEALRARCRAAGVEALRARCRAAAGAGAAGKADK